MSQNPYEPPQQPYQPPQMPPGQTPIQDLEHLKLLSIFHYVVAAMTALFSCFWLIYVVFGFVFLLMPTTGPPGQGPPPAEAKIIGLVIIIIFGAIVLFGWAAAVCVFLAGRFLAAQTHYIFCMIVAGVECLFMPFGTVLGIFTIIVLVRPTVKTLFDAGRNPFGN